MLSATEDLGAPWRGDPFGIWSNLATARWGLRLFFAGDHGLAPPSRLLPNDLLALTSSPLLAALTSVLLMPSGFALLLSRCPSWVLALAPLFVARSCTTGSLQWSYGPSGRLNLSSVGSWTNALCDRGFGGAMAWWISRVMVKSCFGPLGSAAVFRRWPWSCPPLMIAPEWPLQTVPLSLSWRLLLGCSSRSWFGPGRLSQAPSNCPRVLPGITGSSNVTS